MSPTPIKQKVGDAGHGNPDRSPPCNTHMLWDHRGVWSPARLLGSPTKGEVT